MTSKAETGLISLVRTTSKKLDYWSIRPVFVGLVEHRDAGLFVKDVFARDLEPGTAPRSLALRPTAAAGAYHPHSLPPGTVIRCRVVRSVSDPSVIFCEPDTAPLAFPGGALAASYGLACAHAIDPCFPPDVTAEVSRFLGAPGLDDPALVDHLSGPYVTIDNQDSRDLDQAMWITREKEPSASGFVIYYALADASYYVRPGSALWRESIRRGESYYFPGMACSMLPAQFSEGLVSLNEGVIRRALVFEIHAGLTGTLVSSKVYRAKIRSRRKLTYEGVSRFYDAGCTGELAGQDFTETLVLLKEFGLARIADEVARDVVKFRRAEFSVSTRGPGASFSLVTDSRFESEKYNEQVSLICNIAGAKMLIDAGSTLVGIWRIHAPPPQPRLDTLREFLDALAREHGEDPETSAWRWHSTESLADFVARLPLDESNDESIRKARISRAINRAAMMTNVAANIEPQPGPHTGVGAAAYARFSSPMRQVEGIFLHRMLLQSLEKRPVTNEDERLRTDVIESSRLSRKLQGLLTKEANRQAIDSVFASDLFWPLEARPIRRGTVLGIGQDKGRVYVELDNPPVEVKVYLASVTKSTGRSFFIDARATSVMYGTERIRVGDAVGLRVVSGSVAEEPWVLEPITGKPKPMNVGRQQRSLQPPHQPGQRKRTPSPKPLKRSSEPRSPAELPAAPADPAQAATPLALAPTVPVPVPAIPAAATPPSPTPSPIPILPAPRGQKPGALPVSQAPEVTSELKPKPHWAQPGRKPLSIERPGKNVVERLIAIQKSLASVKDPAELEKVQQAIAALNATVTAALQPSAPQPAAH